MHIGAAQAQQFTAAKTHPPHRCHDEPVAGVARGPQKGRDFFVGGVVGCRGWFGKPVPGPEPVLAQGLLKLDLGAQRFQGLVEDGQASLGNWPQATACRRKLRTAAMIELTRRGPRTTGPRGPAAWSAR
jgi:hypothetical protein